MKDTDRQTDTHTHTHTLYAMYVRFFGRKSIFQDLPDIEFDLRSAGS